MYKKILGIAAGTAMMFAAGVAFADTSTVNFENPPYTLGSISGQDGWSSTGAAGSGCAVYDHAVSGTTVAGFGSQSLRISNAVTSGCFGDQTFSKSLTDSAGETAAENGAYAGGVRQNHFEAQWDFASVVPGAEQPGLSVVASPDRGDGARMSWIQMADTPTGLAVNFYDYQDIAPLGGSVGDVNGCGVGDDFVFTPVATGLSRTVPHTIKVTMDFVDGPRNDVVKVYVDGTLMHTGTSWEDYFRYCEGNPTRTVDSLLFRTGGTAAPANAGNGFFIDNLSLLSSIVVPEVHIFKYVDGAQATAASANNATFPMVTTFDSSVYGYNPNVPFTLSTTGWGPTDVAYEASYVGGAAGDDYATNEVTGGSVVGANCADGKPFALQGYTTGNTLAEAQGATKTLTTPSFTDLQSDKYVIVWNIKCPTTGSVSGAKFWDVNGNGVWNAGEPGLGNWTINANNGGGSQVTSGTGAYSFANLLPNTYTLTETMQPGWTQTKAPAPIVLAAGQNVTNADFGNSCFVGTGGKGKGFWTNKNGQALVNVGGDASELAALVAANLRNANGTEFNPANYGAYKTWNTNANAVNMSYMLSAQLSALVLSKEAGFIDGTKQIVATNLMPYSVPGMNALGVITINNLITAANNALEADGYTPAGDTNRAYQEALKNAVESATEGKIQLCQPLTTLKTFTASNSSYYNGPTNASPLYASGPFSIIWDPSTNMVTGGYYTEQSPANTGTVYYNNITGGTVSGNTFNLNFSRTNPNSYSFTGTVTLSGNTVTGTLDGPYYFTATGAVTP